MRGPRLESSPRLVNLLVVGAILVVLVLTVGGCKHVPVVPDPVVTTVQPCPKKKAPAPRAWEAYEGGDCPAGVTCLTNASADALSDELEALRDFAAGR